MSSKLILPIWLTEKTEPNNRIKSTNTKFLTKTIKHFINIFTNVILHNHSNSLGYFQLLDTRLKICLLIAYITLINFSSSFFIYFVVLFTVLIYAKASKINLVKLLKYCWLTIPLLILLASLPAITNLITQGNNLYTVINPNKLLAHGIYITNNGCNTVIRMVVRSGLTLSCTYLVFATTKWNLFTAALAQLKFPKSIIEIIDIGYRYIFLIAKIGRQAVEARYLRTIGSINTRENHKFIGHTIALLFIKTNFIANEVTSAMQLRGYHEYKSIYQFKFQLADYLFILNNLIIGVLIFVFYV